MPETLVALVCHTCGKTARRKRLPTGWKRQGEQVYCREDWRARHILRAVSMPAASPLDGLTWAALRADLKPLWAQATAASNWITSQLYLRDVRREDQAKMPPMPHIYLYPETRKLFPELPPQTVASLEQSLQKKYRARRYDLIWTHAASVPSHRYPVPLPVHNQSWSVAMVGDRPIVSLRLTAGWRRLRLKAGPQFARQLSAVRQMANGEAERGELAIYQQGAALMVKMVAWLPRRAADVAATDTLQIKTAADKLLVAANTKDSALWNYNGDQLRLWTREHRRQLQRWSEDAKFENRPIPNFAERRKAAATKYHHRLNSVIHEIAAQLAGYARRRRFAIVAYDDTVRSYCEDLPWARLRQVLKEKLDAAGIRFEILASGSTEKPQEPSRNGVSE